MQTVISRVLLAFGLLAVAGCALPGRNLNCSTEAPQEKLAKSNATVNSPIANNSLNAPKRQTDPKNQPRKSDAPDAIPQIADDGATPAKRGGETSQLGTGHSTIGTIESKSVDPAERSPSRPPARSQAIDKPARQVKIDAHAENNRSNSLNPGGSDRASNTPSTAAAGSGPIELQGLDFDDVPVSRQQSDSLSGSKSDRPAELAPDSRSATANKAQAVPVKPAMVLPESTPTSKSTGQLPALPWQADLNQLITRIEQDLAQSKPENQPDRQNEFLRKQAQLRLLYLMVQRQEDALTAIPGIDPTQQEYWQQVIWALSNSFDTVQFPELTERAAQTVTPLSAALRLTREEAALSIKNMTFCRKISYFGNYERFPRNEFTPGYEVLLYTEIENFVSTPTVDGEYRTSLKSLIEITDATGKVVWTKGFPPTEDFCRNPRRDYFHNYQFHIPEDLATGTYALKLTIVDELSHKRTSNSLNFVLK